MCIKNLPNHCGQIIVVISGVLVVPQNGVNQMSCTKTGTVVYSYTSTDKAHLCIVQARMSDYSYRQMIP
jgi:hypothetical protein